jgi:PLP dependent protein
MFKQIPENVTVVAVTKTQNVEKIQQAYQKGLTHFGENYLNEALPKIQTLKSLDCQWHYIGTIQTKKCKKLAQYFDWVETVASLEIAKELNRFNQIFNKTQNILIQIKILPDENKGGATFLQAKELIKITKDFPMLHFRGLMTILPMGLSEDEQLHAFQQLKTFFDECNQQYGLGMDTLSMGMSDDYPQAILAGSNMIRLGRAIFGERQ